MSEGLSEGEGISYRVYLIGCVIEGVIGCVRGCERVYLIGCVKGYVRRFVRNSI